MAKKKQTFEEALNRLEEVVSLIEGSEVTLTQSVSLYKEGILLADFCSESLKSVEKEILVLTGEGDAALPEMEKLNELYQ